MLGPHSEARSRMDRDFNEFQSILQMHLDEPVATGPVVTVRPSVSALVPEQFQDEVVDRHMERVSASMQVRSSNMLLSMG